MSHTCPRCRTAIPQAARFCGGCGLSIEIAAGETLAAGRVRDPRPAPLPADFIPIEDAVQLYFHAESSLGGQALIGTEGLRIELFNAGYPLVEATFGLRGEGRDGALVFDLQRSFEELPRGRRIELEVPSYEIREEVRRVRVRLVSAAFARTSEPRP